MNSLAGPNPVIPNPLPQTAWFALLSSIHDFITQEALLKPDDRVLVAVSGGVDSVMLLETLVALRPSLAIETLHVVYLDHGLRPLETPHEKAFVQALAAEHNLPFDSRTLSFSTSGESTQQAARDARIAALEDIAAAHNLHKIATGHHADDQVETLWLRLLRGTTPRGLAGIKAQRERWIRPLLSTPRALIQQAAQARQRSWCEDSSNQSHKYQRNRVRHELLPTLREYNPQLTQHSLLLSQRAREDEAFFSSTLDDLCQPPHVTAHLDGLCLHLPWWETLPAALQWRCLQRLIRRVCGHELQQQHLQHVQTLCAGRHGQQHASVPSSVQITRQYQRLLILPPHSAPSCDAFSVEIPGPGCYDCPSGQLHIQAITTPHTSTSSPWEAFVTHDAAFPWILRNRKGGDRLVFSNHRKRLKKWMIDQKLPQTSRALWPLLLIDQQISWLPGLLRIPPLASPKAPSHGWILRFFPSPTSQLHLAAQHQNTKPQPSQHDKDAEERDPNR